MTIQISNISNTVYSIYSHSIKHEDVALIKQIKQTIKKEHDSVSKSQYKAEVNVKLDSVTSLQVKLFNSFIRGLANSNFKQCELDFSDYLEQTFKNKKTLNTAEILQIYSMCEGLDLLLDRK